MSDPAPVFRIAIPCLNAIENIDETLLSVLTQRGNFVLQIHVMDGGSEDGTQEKLRFWQDWVRAGSIPACCVDLSFSFLVGNDKGMYDALNGAFDILSGGDSDWMTWINAGDRIQPGALATVCQVHRDIPEIQWIGGRMSIANSEGCQMEVFVPISYPVKTLRAGLHDGVHLKIVMQEGVFWRRSLWMRSGATLNSSLRLAGDFELWRQFAHQENYVSINSVLGVFRQHPGQLSENNEAYLNEVESVIQGEMREIRDLTWEEYADTLDNFPELLKVRDFSGPIAFYFPKTSRWQLVHFVHDKNPGPWGTSPQARGGN